uniref:C3H1-type domain-containing protein n=1 Tax=Rhabditophanes sp. KR3021 TaxID=114890 RepID=A0AC35U328_9BILA
MDDFNGNILDQHVDDNAPTTETNGIAKVDFKTNERLRQIEREISQYGYIYNEIKDPRYRTKIADQIVQLTHALYVEIMDHTIPEFPQAKQTALWKSPNLFKTKICNYWLKNNNCHFGNKCWFAHGSDELKKYDCKMKCNENKDVEVGDQMDQSYGDSASEGSFKGSVYTSSYFPELTQPGSVYWSKFCIRSLDNKDRMSYNARMKEGTTSYGATTCLNPKPIGLYEGKERQKDPITPESLLKEIQRKMNEETKRKDAAEYEKLLEAQYELYLKDAAKNKRLSKIEYEKANYSVQEYDRDVYDVFANMYKFDSKA